MEKNTAIIGSGITGLTTAFYLKKTGIKFKIFEKTNHFGGVINTVSENGFVFETGPNSGTLSNIETVELFEYLAGNFELETADETAKKRLILKNNKWYALPSGLFSGISTPLFNVKDKFRLLAEPFRKSGNNPFETISELVIRRMGNSFLDYAVDPFISGIYAGDTNYLVTKYALPKLYKLEQQYGSFIGGAIKKSKEPKSEQDKKVTKKIFSAQGGLSKIVNALVKYIGEENIILNSKIEVKKNDRFYNVENEVFSHVVNTANAGELSSLFPFLHKEYLKDISNLVYAQVAEIAIGFKEWKGIDLDAFGGLIPSKERKNLLGILFMSSIFKNRAPEKGALLTTFVGGIKNNKLSEMPDDELLKLVKPELQELLVLKTFNPDLIKIFYHKKAIAQYGADSKKRLQAIERLEKENKNLFLAGSMRDGISLADRIKQGTELAEIIIKSNS
ncbi:MAG: protoporphyrinogen oxidase [Chlorobi bacterium]|nr:protoporphyrinogen oxidase [Chlorobiota bacterium]